MLQPNDLPLVCLPIYLSDDEAAQLLEFLHYLARCLKFEKGGWWLQELMTQERP
ncbi:MAG: hypothetical protein M3495_17605 [Pseudomonadota bacterium]|nr:hypothetical protein [Gammaproteobacteria bacterium]MDQ3583304.1 hypothetical protein [Pseudomonadota bacterium]